MALSSFTGSFATGTGAAASTVVITGVGFQPKAILFFWSGRSESVDTIGRASHYRGFGVACTTTDRRAIAGNSDDAAAASNANAAHDNAACILSVSGAATPLIDGQMDLQSMDADGFTLVVDDQMPRSLRVHYLALGGDSMVSVISGQFQEAAATGNQDTTGLGFQPDGIIFFSTQASAAPPSAASGGFFTLGAATGAANQAVRASRSRDAQATMSASSYAVNDECFASLANSTLAVQSRAQFVSFLADGFRINWVERVATQYVHYIAFKGGNYLVSDLLTQTDTVTDIVEGSFGFQPSAALFLSNGLTESTVDTVQSDDRLSIGAFSSLTNRGAQATLDETAIADSEITTAIEFDAVYANIKTDSTIDGLMDIKSIDSGGFTMIMDDADPAQAFVWYMAFGPAAAAAGGWGMLLSDSRNKLVVR